MFGATDPGEALPGMRWRLGVPRVEEFSDFSCENHWSRPLGFAFSQKPSSGGSVYVVQQPISATVSEPSRERYRNAMIGGQALRVF